MPNVTRTATLAVAALVISLAAGVSEAQEPADAQTDGACSTTSQAARNACVNGAADDYWIALGNCANLGDASERPECRQDAWQERNEAAGECGDMFEARQQVCAKLGQAPYAPAVHPGQFVDPDEIGGGGVAPNPYLPLQAGRRYEYLNRAAGEKVVVTVSYDTLEIAGVTCRVVHDLATDLESGDWIEFTDDFFAQDQQGNVWYFGEVSRSYEDGLLVSLEGSWRAGIDDAKPGIVMSAMPQVGDVYRQEFMLGEAEDIGEVINLHGSATAPYASCNGTCLVTREYTPLEPGVVERKFYKPGLGQILTVDPATGEREVLVGVSRFSRP